ncbi:hypothetical protein M3603_05815 [Rummeliibacillus stabekisii]|uniref:hypothetical protein n=1 Tax=Rummeliibacillus stabekisii TaxID=241244 RepID=UPI00203F4855|nr:hypothetical protein [Rummeliibacillus stabekisii]MCM3316189.1 hypothetical protein [Rummeliibacillus stabekisii]
MLNIQDHGGVYGGVSSSNKNYLAARIISRNLVTGMTGQNNTQVPYYQDQDTLILSPYASTGINYRYTFSTNSLQNVSTLHNANINQLPKVRVGDYMWVLDAANKRIIIYTANYSNLIRYINITTSRVYSNPGSINVQPSGNRVVVTIQYDWYNGYYETIVFGTTTYNVLYQLSNIQPFVTEWFMNSYAILIGYYRDKIYFYNTSGTQIKTISTTLPYGIKQIKDDDTFYYPGYNSSSGVEDISFVSLTGSNPELVSKFSFSGRITGVMFPTSEQLKISKGGDVGKRIAFNENMFGYVTISFYYISNWLSGISFSVGTQNGSDSGYGTNRYYVRPENLLNSGYIFCYYPYSSSDYTKGYIEKIELLDK